MFQEELKEGTSVFTSDGKEVGEINRFVLDPHTNEVTHIVVQKGWLFTEDKVVPFDQVQSATVDKVVLKEEFEDFDRLPPFEQTHYVEADNREVNTGKAGARYPTYASGPAYYWYPPYGYLGYPAYGLAPYGYPLAVIEQNIPEDTVPLKEGVDVISSDGKHVGHVEELFVDEESKKATHFLISRGLFFKDHKLVPANWIETVTDDQVQLSVSSQVLESLPAYEPE
jgi:uncharacterized protein YrrD